MNKEVITPETRKRREMLLARGFPGYLIHWVNEQIKAAIAECSVEVPLTWIVDPRRRDRATCAVRYSMIKRLRDGVVQHTMTDREGRRIQAFGLRSEFHPIAFAVHGWRPISQPNIAALLGLDHSSVTLVLREQREKSG
jgi:hypothetical protein